jgi:glycolate oxidase
MGMTSLEEFSSLQQIAARARRNLGRNVWDYLMGASESETTLKRNRMGLDSLALVPRILRNVVEVDPSVEFLGRKIRCPVMMAPIGSLQVIESGGAVTVAKAAAEYGTITFMSSVTQPEREIVGASTDAPKVFQLYVRGDDNWIDEQVKSAIDAGFEIFCLTVDTALYSRRERDLIKRWRPSARRSNLDGSDHQAMLSWDNVKRFKDKHDIPLILKGIATGEDAALAVEHGIEVVYVSNHGGRQLDHGRGSIDVLPEVVEAVNGRAEVLIDSGFMRGTDVIKALALGAKAVCIGKLQGLGLAAGGQAGLVRTLELLESEIRISMALCGLHNFEEINSDFIQEVEPVIDPHVTSPYTHIDFQELEYDR